MPAPPKILSLIDTFDRNADAYLAPHFNEAMLRQQFVNPFSKCLGWDMDNEQGYAEAYKNVIHEDAIKVGGATKAPDYCFRIGGTRKFFLEAKKPAVNLKDDPQGLRTKPYRDCRRFGGLRPRIRGSGRPASAYKPGYRCAGVA